MKLLGDPTEDRNESAPSALKVEPDVGAGTVRRIMYAPIIPLSVTTG